MPLIVKELLDLVCQSKPKVLCEGMTPIHKGKKEAWFKDNGSDILAVAHLDTVNPCGIKWSGEVKLDQTIFFSPYLDDRLGAYTIKVALPQAYSIEMDMLFTMDEETGASTAELFETTKKYKWIVSFDRRGEDVVLYSFRGDDIEKKLKSVGFDVGWGTMSDICKLEHLGCKAFNVGVGYEEEHGKHPYMIVEVYNRQIQRFVKFYEKFKGEHIPHSKVIRPDYSSNFFPRHQEISPQISGFGAGREQDWTQPNLLTAGKGGHSEEYKGWSTKRERRELRKRAAAIEEWKRQHADMTEPEALYPPNTGVCPVPVWCPKCARKLNDKECPTCGLLVMYRKRWWPEVDVPVCVNAGNFPF